MYLSTLDRARGHVPLDANVKGVFNPTLNRFSIDQALNPNGALTQLQITAVSIKLRVRCPGAHRVQTSCTNAERYVETLKGNVQDEKGHGHL